jgi:hypothetical protein
MFFPTAIFAIILATWGGGRNYTEQRQVRAVALVTSKAVVALTKSESISRLEIDSCVIGTRLGLTVPIALDALPIQSKTIQNLT